MAKDIAGVHRYVVGYSKIADEDGDQRMEVEYRLKDIDLSFLRQLFNPDPDDYTMVLGYEISKDQAQALQSYVKDGVIDVDKYDFTVSCFQAPGSNWGRK